jgi:hypothetical protein
MKREINRLLPIFFLNNKLVGRASSDDNKQKATIVTYHGMYFLPVLYNARMRHVTRNNLRHVLFPHLKGVLCQPISTGTQVNW